jgi:hypothetical protein
MKQQKQSLSPHIKRDAIPEVVCYVKRNTNTIVHLEIAGIQVFYLIVA